MSQLFERISDKKSHECCGSENSGGIEGLPGEVVHDDTLVVVLLHRGLKQHRSKTCSSEPLLNIQIVTHNNEGDLSI
jgi:hypothetical protein